MATKDQIQSTTSRVGMLAMLYYPEITIDDPEFDLKREVSWCLVELNDDEADKIRDDVARAIVDPTAHRTALYSLLYDLEQES